MVVDPEQAEPPAGAELLTVMALPLLHTRQPEVTVPLLAVQHLVCLQ